MISKRKCVYSPDGCHRYTLWREWDSLDLSDRGYVQFIGLNPSTATDDIDDPTVRRCIRFAKSWGYGALCMTNAFAFRATDPRVMKAHSDPIGPENDKWLVSMAKDAGIVIAAWGVHGAFMNRDEAILKLLPEVHCLGTTKEGYPRHPLYLPKTAQPEFYVHIKYVRRPK